MRVHLGAALFFLLPQASIAQTCEQADFAAVVSEASSALAAMNDENKKAFQAKLAGLKAREGWADAEFTAKATPFVKDETTAQLDEGNKALLGQVPQLGAPQLGDAQLAGALAAVPAAPDQMAAKRCAMLGELKALMAKVVENTRAKWAHMFGKLDAVLNAPRPSKTAGR